VSGSGISRACKSAPRSRQINTPAPHHSVFYRPYALPAAQPTASKHWRHYYFILKICIILAMTNLWIQLFCINMCTILFSAHKHMHKQTRAWHLRKNGHIRVDSGKCGFPLNPEVWCQLNFYMVSYSFWLPPQKLLTGPHPFFIHKLTS